MQLYIDGKAIQARPQQSLRELVCALGLDDRYLSRRPLAARIAGEVFTLNYIRKRNFDTLLNGIFIILFTSIYIYAHPFSLVICYIRMVFWRFL